MLKENLLSLRNFSGATQEQIAEVAGVSRQAYSKWERGEATPGIEHCQRLARHYGVSVDALLNKPQELEGRKMPPAPNGKYIFGVVTVNERGQIVIPQKARELFGLSGGSRLVVLGDEAEGIALVNAEIFEEQLEILKNSLGEC
jgi:AbrB family looped-hinge helix DNA binding protein